MNDYKNFRAQKHEEKLEAFASCILMMAIIFLLLAIGAVSELDADITDVPAFIALELGQCEQAEPYQDPDFLEVNHDQFF